MQRRFVTVDVFTEKPFGGNPLAVVLDAEGLETEQMQNLAMEFNLAETTFVLPPKDPAHTAGVRIFTPRYEVPFAGHPNIGTAYVLANRGKVGDNFVFEEKAGLVEIELLKDGSAVRGARLQAPQGLTRGEDFSVEDVAEACSLSPAAFTTTQHEPCLISCGLPFVVAELASLEALAAAVPRTELFKERFPAERVTGIYLYTEAGRDGVDIQCRMFAPLQGVYEDPATGSANVALIGFLASLADENNVKLTRTIAQGVELGRPSLLIADTEKRDGEVVRSRIGGSCVGMMEGTFEL